MSDILPTSAWPAPASAGSSRSVLAEDLHIDGSVTSAGEIELRGKVVGVVTAPAITVLPSGEIDGAAIGHDVSVTGRVSGRIAAKNVTLVTGAGVLAEITHDRIVVENGVHFEGSLRRLR